MMDIERLKQQWEQGQIQPMLLFWGHSAADLARVGPWVLSNWFPAPFELDGLRYPTTEHHMMAQKAVLFGDDVALAKILEAETPAEAKKLGRTVRGFDEQRWRDARAQIVYQGNLAKFRQHEHMGQYLRATEGRILVEASPMDRIWGIGLSKDDARAQDPRTWRGQNLLGFVLMEVRQQLHADSPA